MEHRKPPNNYRELRIVGDSPIGAFLHNSIRHELTALKYGIRTENTWVENHGNTHAHPNLSHVSLGYYPERAQELEMSVGLYDTTPNKLVDGSISVIDVRSRFNHTPDETHYLRDLGGVWNVLEAEIIALVVDVFELPPKTCQLERFVNNEVESGVGLEAKYKTTNSYEFGIVFTIPKNITEYTLECNCLMEFC